MSSSNYTPHERARFRQGVNREVTAFLQRIESLSFGNDGDYFSKRADDDERDISDQYDDYVEKKRLAEERKRLTEAKRRELEDRLEDLDRRLADATHQTRALLWEVDAKRCSPNAAEATEALARYRAHETERYNLSAVRDRVKSELRMLAQHIKGV
jgi:chromosome segregation ATPase